MVKIPPAQESLFFSARPAAALVGCPDRRACCALCHALGCPRSWLSLRLPAVGGDWTNKAGFGGCVVSTAGRSCILGQRAKRFLLAVMVWRLFGGFGVPWVCCCSMSSMPALSAWRLSSCAAAGVPWSVVGLLHPWRIKWAAPLPDEAACDALATVRQQRLVGSAAALRRSEAAYAAYELDAAFR